MKAVLPEIGIANARMEDKKEQVAKYTLIAYDAMEHRPFQEIVTARVWMGRSANASTVYASLWVHGKNYYTTGRGQAGVPLFQDAWVWAFSYRMILSTFGPDRPCSKDDPRNDETTLLASSGPITRAPRQMIWASLLFWARSAE